MKFGFVLPWGGPHLAAELAQAVEAAGWDGFFVWEPVWGFDAWVLLTAAASQTERIRLGTMITPLSRMRPWKLASETVALDHFSRGRVTLAVGLGAPDTGWEAFGETTDRRVRAELLDEGLEILTGLWAGQPYQFEGKHYRVTPTDFMPPPPPIQQPRIPVWVVGAYPFEKSMQRALRYDGLLPNVRGADGRMGAPTPAQLGEIAAYVRAQRPVDVPFDLVVEGVTPGDDPPDAAGIVRGWASAGATWWIESMWQASGEGELRQRIHQGPPRLESG